MPDDQVTPVGRGADPEKLDARRKVPQSARPHVFKPLLTPNGLTLDEMAFAVEYVRTGNGSKAVLAVWPESKAPAAKAHALIKKPAVAAYLQRRRLEKLQAAELNVDYVLSRFKRLADSNIKDLYREDGTLKSPNELHEDVAAAIASIEVEITRINRTLGDGTTTEDVEIKTMKIRRWDPLKALEALAKWLKMFDENAAPPSAPPALAAITTTDQVAAAREYQKLIAG